MFVNPVPIFKGMVPQISDRYDAAGLGSRVHMGTDIMYRRPAKGGTQLPVYSPNYQMPPGVPALAFAAGKVSRAGVIGTGGRVQIEHGNGLATKYYHLRNIRVKEGDHVKAGQPVGEISHNPAGYQLNHLHFEALKNGIHVDPGPLLANAMKVPAPVGFLGKVGVSIVVGLLAFKYLFK